MQADPVKVTFDSNVWENIVLAEKLAVHSDKADLAVIKDAISNESLKPYISDVIVVLEAIRKSVRATVIQSFSIARIVRRGAVTTSPDGLLESHSTTTMHATVDLPALHEKLSKAIEAAFKIGFKFIKVNRIGFPMLERQYYEFPGESTHSRKKNLWAQMEQLQLGSYRASQIGEQVRASNTDLQLLPPLIAFAFAPQAAVPELVAEWADGDAVMAHYYSDHDYFCTLDFGKGAGKNSILHQSHRDWLAKDFGIKIVSPSELAALLQNGF